MTKEALERLIGEEATRDISEMGGVTSKVVSAHGQLLSGELTPQEGLNVFDWAVRKEAELKKVADQKQWRMMVDDSMDGRPLEQRGRRWFRNWVNKDALFLGRKPHYPTR